MAAVADTTPCREGKWSLIVVSDKWSIKLRQRILPLVEQQPFSRHPQTLKLRSVEKEEGEFLFLKVFHRARGLRGIKDIFRESKAVRSLRQSGALGAAGFSVPAVVAAGEYRRFGVLQRAFLLTCALDGQPATQFLLRQQGGGARRISLKMKRDGIKHLAQQIQRFHSLGFVHGDLVPGNILVQERETLLRFFIMDNDRTRRYPRWLPQRLWRRNLIQLNRFSLPGISLQDRMRFFRAYAGEDRDKKRSARLARWLEKKTRRRREELEGIDSNLTFRQLMRWEEERGSLEQIARLPG